MHAGGAGRLQAAARHDLNREAAAEHGEAAALWVGAALQAAGIPYQATLLVVPDQGPVLVVPDQGSLLVVAYEAALLGVAYQAALLIVADKGTMLVVPDHVALLAVADERSAFGIADELAGLAARAGPVMIADHQRHAAGRAERRHR